MKICISFKTPDAISYALDDLDLDEDARAEAEEKLEKFIEYGECVSITFDLDTNTAIVNKRK